MSSTRLTTFPEPKALRGSGRARRPSIARGPFVGPALVVGLGAAVLCVLLDVVILALIAGGPPAGKTDSFFIELAILIPGSLLAGLAAILHPSKARTAIPYLFLILAWHTGLQISFSKDWPVVLSAIDVLVPAMILIGLAGRWHAEQNTAVLTERIVRLFLYFGVFCLWGLVLGVARGVDMQAMLMNFKAFAIYPLIVLLMLWCIRTWSQIYVAVGLFLALVVERALVGLLSHSQTAPSAIIVTGQFARTGHVVTRINGNFASVNQYAFYIMSGALLMAALITLSRSYRIRALLALPLFATCIAIVLTLSRGAWLACAAGLVVIAVFLRLRRAAIVLGLVVLLYGALQGLQPSTATLVSGRISGREYDQSLTERQQYYQVGEQVIIHYPLGAGWGAAFALTPSGIVPDHSNVTDWPWYHNDYLQLTTEIGIPGLLIFAWIWFFILREGLRAARLARDRTQAAMVAGLVTALVGMLVQAATDQFFWRTDIGPHIWIVAGILMAAVNIISRERTDAAEPSVQAAEA